jgi:hypothetical protein
MGVNYFSKTVLHLIYGPVKNLGAFAAQDAENRAFRGYAYASFFAPGAKNAPRPSNPLRGRLLYTHWTFCPQRTQT